MNTAVKDTVSAALSLELRRINKLPALPLLMMQSGHESGGYNSHVSTVNNFTGIKWAPKSAIAGEYDSGIRSPEGNNYSGFKTPEIWAKRYIGIISRGSPSPIDSSSVTEFAQRLKNRGYYTDTLTNYTNGLLSWAKMLKMPFNTGGTVSILLVIVVAVAVVYWMD